MKRKNEKDHYAKKSPGSVEVFKKQRKAKNAARPKQRWAGGELHQRGRRLWHDSLPEEPRLQWLAIREILSRGIRRQTPLSH